MTFAVLLYTEDGGFKSSIVLLFKLNLSLLLIFFKLLLLGGLFGLLQSALELDSVLEQTEELSSSADLDVVASLLDLRRGCVLLEELLGTVVQAELKG